MARRTGRIGRKLVFGAALLGGMAFGAVATAEPVSSPGVPSATEEAQAAEEPASVRPESDGDAVVIDLSGLDAAVEAARLADATTTTTTAPPVTEAPPAADESPSTTTTTAAPARAAARTAPAPTTTTTAPPPPPPPPPPAPSSSAEEAIAHWFPDVYDQAVSVARCESSMNPDAVSSGGGNHGLFQINNVHRSSFESVTGRPWSDIYDADANAQFARHLYNQSGWDPWACQP